MTTTPSQYTPSNERMPVVFVGHGSPMNSVEDNAWSRGFTELGGLIPKPRAILSVSAHWFVRGTYLTGGDAPRTIHDFGGFPRALYEIDYPAPGNADLAERVAELVSREHDDDADASLSQQWGLDHGTWSVLKWTYPEADVPVVQLSIDQRLGIREHFELARSLQTLRDQGVLVFGSGNIVHNLRHAFHNMRTGGTDTPEWASRFDETVKQALLQHDTEALLTLLERSPDGQLAHPTPDHWLPLIYALALTDDRDVVRFPNEGFDLGSISMRNVIWRP